MTESGTAPHRRTFYEHQRSLAVLMSLILFPAFFAEVSVTGLPGAVIGAGLSVAAYLLLPPLRLLLGR